MFCTFYRNIAGGSGGTGAIDLPDLVGSASAQEKLNIDDRTLILEGLKSGKRPVKVDCGAMPAFMKAPGKCYFPRALFLRKLFYLLEADRKFPACGFCELRLLSSAILSVDAWIASAISFRICRAIMMFASYFGGVAIDRFGYRFIFVWDLLFNILATGVLLRVYRLWRKLGGATGNYVPPVS
ncbi:hypothetical protein [Victivallis vadensis]|uniref:hypothetical protein n=1 Tax=Victivallis vadensis TaxID=172901 RepID=UPI0023F0CD80|nr:hypothetical protein [Victivallis vadensis]